MGGRIRVEKGRIHVGSTEMGRGCWGVSDHHQPRRAEESQLRASGAMSWWPRMECMDHWAGSQSGPSPASLSLKARQA